MIHSSNDKMRFDIQKRQYMQNHIWFKILKLTFSFYYYFGFLFLDFFLFFIYLNLLFLYHSQDFFNDFFLFLLFFSFIWTIMVIICRVFLFWMNWLLCYNHFIIINIINKEFFENYIILKYTIIITKQKIIINIIISKQL